MTVKYRLLTGVSFLALCIMAETGKAQTVTPDGDVPQWDGSPLTSPWDVGGDLYVGRSGAGTLVVEDGGSVSNRIGYLGAHSGSTGSATVTGPDSIWTNSEWLSVGHFGTGTLTVEDRGSVKNTYAYIGYDSGITGRVTVRGAGSSWTNTSTVSVGFYGTGTLVVENGGSVSNTGGYLGYNSSGMGTATVTGIASTWDNSGELAIGFDGTGTLVVKDGGNVRNAYGYLGTRLGSTGSATVSGPGSSWINTSILSVGLFGTGVLTVEGGGSVSTRVGSLGANPGSTGSATVTGPGSSWANSDELYVGGSGKGTLVVENGGHVSNTNGYLGRDSGSTGIVMVTGLGSEWTNDNLLSVGNFGTGTLMVGDGGSVSASEVRLATISGSSGTLIIGAAQGETATAPGTLNAATVSFGDGSAEMIFNHTGTDYTFSSVLESSGTGTHRIEVLSGITKLTADNSGFSGTTEVNGGKLIVNGNLGGSLDIAAGSWLGGSGTIGSGTGSLIQAMSGATIAPGNSIGTLTVMGDLLLSPGSIYEVEIANDGRSDLINVIGGTATVADATVKPMTLDPETSYRDGQTYRIVSASNGVTGQFPTIATTSAFLDYSLAYDANTVDLTVRVKSTTPPVTPEPPVVFQSVAETPNQYATAGALDSLAESGPSLALYNRLLMLDADQARSAFDALSGEIYASTRTALVEDSRHVREAMNARLRAAFDATGASSSPVIAYDPANPSASVAPDYAGAALWTYGFGSWGSGDSNDNAAATDRRTGGVLLGMDADVADWRVGLVAGYSRSNIEADARLSSADSDNWHAGLYGGTQWGSLALRGGAAYTWSNIDTSRNIVIPGLQETEKAGYDAGLVQAFGELAYGLDAGGTRFEPFANLAHVSLHRDGFQESGGMAALSGRSDTQNVTFTTIGLRAEHQLKMGDAPLLLSGMLGWRHAFGDRTAESIHAFDTGNAFLIEGVPITTDSAAIDFGVDLELSQQASVGLSYSGQWSSSARDNAVKAQLKVKF